jgi:hypothetical protein
MKYYPRLLPIWLLALLLSAFSFMQYGCRTGGTWINPGSSGSIIKGKTPAQMNEETAARREESETFQNAQPVPSPQVLLPPARSKPKDTTAQSVEANPVVVDPEPAGELEPFTPTISPIPAKLPPVETKLSPKKIEGDGGCVRPSTTDDKTTTPEIAGPYETAPKEGSVHRSKVELFSVFVMLLLGAIGFWVVYDIIKDSINMKKQGAPIKDHLKNLKKPAKGTRASRKKATVKKKSTKNKK